MEKRSKIYQIQFKYELFSQLFLQTCLLALLFLILDYTNSLYAS